MKHWSRQVPEGGAWITSFRAAPTSRKIEIPFVVIAHFRDGKLAHEHIYWDGVGPRPNGLARSREPPDRRCRGLDPKTTEQCAYVP
jgi:hypothetical protein